MRIQYLPEIFKTGESPFFPPRVLDRLDDPDQTAGVVLFKPVNADDVVFQDFPRTAYSYITKEVTGRLQEGKKMNIRMGDRRTRRRGDAVRGRIRQS